MRDALRERLRALRADTLAVYFAARDPRLPWRVRLVALAVAAYALSPIDLIPDFVPVLGLLDDLLLLPLGIALVVRLTPPGCWPTRAARRRRRWNGRAVWPARPRWWRCGC